MRNLRLFILVWCAFSPLAPTVQADTFYVSQADPFASDGNPGTKTAPFKTITRAAEVIRGGDQVVVGPGRYTELIDLDGSHSGTSAAPTTWTGSPAVAATIDGIRILSNYVIVEGFALVSRTKPADVRGFEITVRNVKYLDAPKTIRDVVSIQAEVMDDVGVASVRFLLSGLLLLPRDYDTPFIGTLNTMAVPDGVYALTGIASDAAGNEGADTILVEIENECNGRRCR